MAWSMAKPASASAPLPEARYERKFLISELWADEVESLVKLHPAIFSEAYEPRAVNSIYLDTFDLRSYFENLAGVSERAKARVRWYGALSGWIEKPVLELKCKQNALGRKELYPLAPFRLDEDFSLSALREAFEASELPPRLGVELLSLTSALLVRYQRKYFQSACGRFRLTLDQDLEFYRLAASGSLLHKAIDNRRTILELKYDREQEAESRRVAGYFPFRLNRVSKYVLGVERLNLW